MNHVSTYYSLYSLADRFISISYCCLHFSKLKLSREIITKQVFLINDDSKNCKFIKSRMRRYVCALAAVLHQQTRPISTMKVKNFKDWKFRDPPSYAELPIDDNPEYNVPVAVKDAIFSKVPVEPLTGTIHLVCASDDALTDLLDLEPAVAEQEEFVDFLAGKYLPDGGLSVSHRYGGYQFGYWADQLGDGRAHILGEYVNSAGESYQIQLKGSGETPYSRFGDGRAVLRSSIREMIASEANHYLGIPTTRAVGLVVSDTHKVHRDIHYSGRSKQERCAIVARVAPAWYRGGSVEILKLRREPELMVTLVDFIIKHHFPTIKPTDEDKYVKWFSEVAHKNLDMVATWQGLGFTHGVLNTDNVSIFGLTIDYGPYGFVEMYNEHYVPNTSDDMGRYAFNKQPSIIIWNMNKLSEAMDHMFTEDQKLKIKEIKATFDKYVTEKILKTYLLKLGLEEIKDGDQVLVDDLLVMMQNTMADFTGTFRQMAELNIDEYKNKSILSKKWSVAKLCEATQWDRWVDAYRGRLEEEHVCDEMRRRRMCAVNPVYVPRNWMLQDAIADAENDDFEKVQFLLKLFKKPFEVNEEAEKRGYSASPPNWSHGLKLSCSS